MLPWTIPQQVPVIAPGTPHPGLDDVRAGAAHVIKVGDRYRRVYYWGSDRQNRNYLLQAEAPLREWLEARDLEFEVVGDETAAAPQRLAAYEVVLASSVYLVPDDSAARLAVVGTAYGQGCSLIFNWLLWVRPSDVVYELLGIGLDHRYAVRAELYATWARSEAGSTPTD